MNDLEISKALALAIGWVENKLDENGCNDSDIAVFHGLGKDDEVKVWDGEMWRSFDYRDPAVIWPIAAKFDCFPGRYSGSTWVAYVGSYGEECFESTPEKAVALATIKAMP